jgi:DNA-binding MarR family transcriptional regulator
MADRPDFETSLGSKDRMELRVWLRLLTCTNLLGAEVRQRLKQTADTTLPRFDILAQLERAGGPMSMGDLSRHLMVSNGNVTGLVDRLAREGLVERTPSPSDRRVQMVSLTKDGAAFFATIAGEHRRWIGEMMAGLSDEEMTTLYDLLARLKDSILAAEGDDNLEAAE